MALSSLLYSPPPSSELPIGWARHSYPTEFLICHLAVLSSFTIFVYEYFKHYHQRLCELMRSLQLIYSCKLRFFNRPSLEGSDYLLYFSEA
ncbi:hypothetical protein Avbf_06169 [Armadillidium vulgare]|nr:hypothetical protein Avbf_06169 [Armadillidium vulgare]